MQKRVNKWPPPPAAQSEGERAASWERKQKLKSKLIKKNETKYLVYKARAEPMRAWSGPLSRPASGDGSRPGPVRGKQAVADPFPSGRHRRCPTGHPGTLTSPAPSREGRSISEPASPATGARGTKQVPGFGENI